MEPVIDVRSEGEFEKGHIPGALSLPLFSNEERAIVGTLYKQEGREKAVRKGLEIVNPKLSSFVERVDEIGSGKLRIHCWRGGMRSESMAWLLEKSGWECQLLDGGYKAYRKAMLDFFSEKLPLKVITGYTGSGKTLLLGELNKLGEQVVDLEAIANHQGSSFGNYISDGQPTTEQFQNDLFHEMRQLDLTKTIWVEDESICIGKVALPEVFYQQKNTSPHYRIHIPEDERLDLLVADYGNIGADNLKDATLAIRKKLNPSNTAEALQFIQEGNLKEAARIILRYYDKAYQKAFERKKKFPQMECEGSMSDLPQVAKRLSNTK